jgi:hypothetical protein
MVISFFDLVGNVASTTLDITRIDRTPLTGTITYTPSTATNGNVIATISFNKTGVVITTTGGDMHHIFTGNDSFEFTFIDPAGNT